MNDLQLMRLRAKQLREKAAKESDFSKKKKLLAEADELALKADKFEKRFPSYAEKKKSSHKGLIAIVFLALIAFCVYSMFQIMKVSMNAGDLLVPVGVILLSVIILFKQFEHK